MLAVAPARVELAPYRSTGEGAYGGGLSPRYILLVEDNADDEALALRALARADQSVHVDIARDGAEALDRLLHGTKLPEIILLDLKLPKLSGLDVLRRIRADARTLDVPVIVLTSSSEENDILESYRAGANAYVRKPVDFEQFMRTLGELVHFWLLVNESPIRVAKQR